LKELEELMSEGWDVFVECKGKGRECAMTYEGTMFKVDGNPVEKLIPKHHAVGDTVEELVENLRDTIE